MKRLAASALYFAAGLCELAAALLYAMRDIATWRAPKTDANLQFAIGESDDPWERWAEGEGRPALRSLERGGSGML